MALGLPFWVENPDTSWIWRYGRFPALLDAPTTGLLRVDFCAFGTPWRKRTRVLTNIGALIDNKVLCPGCKSHLLLRGRCKTKRMSWTKVAEPYPAGFAAFLAMGLAGASGTRPEFRRLDVAACAKASTLRIGEAVRPGPRTTKWDERKARREGQCLEEVRLVSEKTFAMENKLWAGFRDWLSDGENDDLLNDLLDCPVTVAVLLKEYGSSLFAQGATLSAFRHLLTYAQRVLHGFRFHSRPCWDLVTRWERLEPLVHRAPMPLKLCEGMASLAICWRWPAFALVILIAFKGILRPGEVLRAVRRDLVLPSDLLHETCVKFYLKVREPKTQRRGGGRTQHTSVEDPALASACEAVFGSYAPEEKLFSLSGQSFRRRWDAVLRALGVPADLKLTPASLRGGGAIHSYQSGNSVQGLLWKMRIQHVSTLEHYLQELAAENIYADLSPSARKSVQAACALLPVMLASLTQ